MDLSAVAAVIIFTTYPQENRETNVIKLQHWLALGEALIWGGEKTMLTAAIDIISDNLTPVIDTIGNCAARRQRMI